MNSSTLKRRIKKYGLQRKIAIVTLTLSVMQEDLYWMALGVADRYRGIWHTLQMNRMTVPRVVVAELLRELHPEERLIKCGVPQGSILGPLFFLLYINDLPQCLNKTKPRLFTDDTNLTASGDSIIDLEIAVNSDLENLRKWLIANKLSLNVAKTEFMLIGSKAMIKNNSDSRLNVFIENKQIKQVSECNTLGVIVDQHLSWKKSLLHVVAGCKTYLNEGRFTWRHDSVLNFIASILKSVNHCNLYADLPGYISPSVITGESLLHVVAGCQCYLDRFTWRHNSILNFLANTLQTVNGSALYADVPGFKSPSIITGDTYRQDLLLSLSNGSLYVVELTVGYETNLENNVTRKKAKYKELVKQLDENFNEVNFINLSMSSLGIFAQECSTFLEMLGNVGLDKNYQTYCVRKMMTIAIRSTYYIFCCRNKELESPDLLTI
ncbi:Hypothetical predicted protein [Paramuricea clavata]|uniref:Uncharacterized protein n=1 Tax=Paramuricea clavata TaxID=317549 RepID=A0A6S7JLG1_PARCT|nr:Hypothetical predicted protein [Paramuricea clavata]